jgi:hypothetical protein
MEYSHFENCSYPESYPGPIDRATYARDLFIELCDFIAALRLKAERQLQVARG